MTSVVAETFRTVAGEWETLGAAEALQRANGEEHVGKWWFRLGRGQHGAKRYADALNSFHSGLQCRDAGEGTVLCKDLQAAMQRSEGALRSQWQKVAELSARAAKVPVSVRCRTEAVAVVGMEQQ